MQTVLPTGTLTFLFTDVESSTRHWESEPLRMRDLLARHDAVVRGAIERNHGIVFKTAGDAFYSAFDDALHALAAAADLQQSIALEDWSPLANMRVRVALHTGTAQQRDGDYFGPALNRLSRVLHAADGGQIVVSESTERLVRDDLPERFELVDLGAHKLRDLARPQHLYELRYPGSLELPVRARSRVAVSNLPAELSTFVGRSGEVARLRKLLAAQRLVTIVGTGGVGKTRIAWRVARMLADRFSSGVWRIDAATVSNESALLQTLCKTMRLGTSGPDPFAKILYAIDDRPVLFVFDNAERCIQVCAGFASTLLEAAPNAKVMVTSREPLRVAGEHAFMLDPLPTPDPSSPAAELRKNDSVRLFLDRAVASGARLALDAKNSVPIAAICKQLDGIPLAIELAAARTLTLAPAQIVERLSQRFDLLTGGAQGSVDHHRTLRLSIDWSYDLLSDAGRNAFVQGAVFQGAFTCEAAERVFGRTAGTVELLDALDELVSKSFLRTVEENGAKRYAYLETLRAYALERLTESGTLANLAQAHFAYHRDVIDSDRDEAVWLDALEGSYRDIVAALEWALERDPAEAARLALRLGSFCHTRGYFGEGAALLERVAKLAGADARQNAHVLVAAAGLRNAVGDNDRAREDAAAARDLFASLNDEAGGLKALGALANAYTNAGEYEPAHAAFSSVLDGFTRFPDPVLEAQTLANIGIVLTAQAKWNDAKTYLLRALEKTTDMPYQRLHAWVVGSLGNLAQQSGNALEARTWYEQSLKLCRAIGEKSAIAILSVHLAQIAMATEDPSAPRLIGEALELTFEHGLMLQLVDALDARAEWATIEDDVVTAGKLFGATQALRHRLRFPLKGAEYESRLRIVEGARAKNPPLFAQAESAGKLLDVEEAVRLARANLRRAH